MRHWDLKPKHQDTSENQGRYEALSSVKSSVARFVMSREMVITVNSMISKETVTSSNKQQVFNLIKISQNNGKM